MAVLSHYKTPIQPGLALNSVADTLGVRSVEHQPNGMPTEVLKNINRAECLVFLGTERVLIIATLTSSRIVSPGLCNPVTYVPVGLLCNRVVVTVYAAEPFQETRAPAGTPPFPTLFSLRRIVLARTAVYHRTII